MAIKRFPLFRVVSRAPGPALVLMGAGAGMVALTAASLAIFGVQQGITAMFVLALPVLALLSRSVGRGTAKSARARWGSVSVGTDGLLVDVPAGTRFISFGRVVEVRSHGVGRVIIQVEDGERVELACEDSDDLEPAIERAWAAYGAAPGLGRSELEIGDGDASAYLKRAQALLTAGDFRTRPMSEGDLAAVAMDPRAPALQRVGAVAALKDAAGAVRVKLRVAVEATVEPELREALDEALDEALTVETVTAQRAKP